MKKIIDRNTRLFARAYWFIRHRWYAAVIVAIIAIIGRYVFEIELNAIGIIIISLGLVLENTISILWLNCFKNSSDNEKRYKCINKNINFQITYDLVALTFLIHFSGGVENPFIVAYFFHIGIAGILLSKRAAYIQTTLAVLLLSIAVSLEYNEIIPHYCLCIKDCDFTHSELYLDMFVVIKSLSIFIVSFYIFVYIASAIGQRLQKQEENYTKAIIRLNEKDEFKNEYVLRMTHDIKGHIGVVQSSLGVVVKGIFGKIEGRNNEFILAAHNRTAVLIKFITDLLKLTRMRLKDEFTAESFLLKETLAEAFENIKIPAKEKSIELTCSIDKNISEITGNKVSIKEITTNLMLNAIKYTLANGKISLEAYNYPDFVKIQICDNGIGIPKNEISKIFDEFFRASNVNTQKVDGTGIGLTIVKKIVDRHKGDIWVESEEGKGSVFIFTLPKILIDGEQIK